MATSILNNPLAYLPGISVQNCDLLQKELVLFTFEDLLNHFPIRHIDRTKFDFISELRPEMEFTQVRGKLISLELIGDKRSKRLLGKLKDETGVLDLVWFQGISWVHKSLIPGQYYNLYGRLAFFNGRPQIAHPEMDMATTSLPQGKAFLEPVYPSTEKLKSRRLTGRALGKLTHTLLKQLTATDVPEMIPLPIRQTYRLIDRLQAYQQIHFPASLEHYQQAVRRLKFEEFFVAQWQMQLLRINRHRQTTGLLFDKVGNLFNDFYHKNLPFSLTDAQKKVLKEIRKDLGSGRQMNRLLQGDVGSGKTIVALLSMLIALDNGFQAVLMAPTEILARQHFESIQHLLNGLDVKIALLTGSTKAKARKSILSASEEGSLQILIGTHAVIEEKVQFLNLGLAIVDEQHKFGVAQRAGLRKKNTIAPHVLVMTATPIPRTLALTAYGDLDYSVIDELPPGRKPILTVHRYENKRHTVMEFIKEQIALGRQVYLIYPLIEESSKMDYENLQKGYEEVKSFFPEPTYWISMVHGKQPPDIKESNMKRFVTGDTSIMVSTTVIEVGVNVPNASVMVIESAEKFGLSQLHQLRGRVGRGADQSYCILLTGLKISADARERLNIMVETNDGFKIAEKDLEIRGPGEMEGTKQSGAVLFKLASIVTDRQMLEVVCSIVTEILEKDPDLNTTENQPLLEFMKLRKGKTAWSKIA